MNSLNDGTYYVNINFNVCFNNNNLCHIYIYIYIYIYNLFQLERERGMKVARACELASELSLQAMRLLQKQLFHLLIAEKYNVASQ